MCGEGSQVDKRLAADNPQPASWYKLVFMHDCR